MVALSLAVSQGGIAATVSAEPRMADSVPSGSTDVEPDPVAAAMDVDGVADEPWLAQAKVVRELMAGMMAKVVAEYSDGERQRTAEPCVPRFPPTPAACCHAQTDDRCSPHDP